MRKASICKNKIKYKRHVRSYRIEIIDLKDPLVQLEASKSSIKYLFKYLLHAMKGFKYQITVNGDIEFVLVCFNSTTKIVVNLEFDLDKYFQEILYRIDIWINEGSDWVIESIDTEYVNIYILSPLSGSTYIELPRNLRKSMKGLINIKNNYNK